MRSWQVLIVIAALCGLGAAQVTIPGTFTRAQPGAYVGVSGLIVSPPVVTFGNTLSPTVVAIQDAVAVVSPFGVAVPAQHMLGRSQAEGEQRARAGEGPRPGDRSRRGDQSRESRQQGPVPGSMADTSVSLGEVARRYRPSNVTVPRTLTNADVDRMNARTGVTPSQAPKAGTERVPATKQKPTR
ncbi:MAG TPA: hypothetical protein VEG32_03815 [Clostridia bacterium]|nr:hypothetical protein [Clostridia bacterium]